MGWWMVRIGGGLQWAQKLAGVINIESRKVADWEGLVVEKVRPKVGDCKVCGNCEKLEVIEKVKVWKARLVEREKKMKLKRGRRGSYGKGWAGLKVGQWSYLLL